MDRLCRCGATLTRYQQTCTPCKDARHVAARYASGQYAAIAAVYKAKRLGEILPPSSFTCADCGKPATAYDHRDYNYPLMVEAVCHGCNLRRGPALPKNWSAHEFMEWLRITTNKKFGARTHLSSGITIDVVERAYKFFRPDDWQRIWPELIEVA